MYNPFNAMNGISAAKNKYNKATTDEERNKARAEAAQYYDELKAKGRSDLANQMGNSDYANSLKVIDSEATKGMQPVRSYAKSAMGQYGGVNDNAFAYNPYNKDVSINGVSLGSADYVTSDGRAYMKPEKLNKNLQAYLDITGATPTLTNQYQNKEREISQIGSKNSEQNINTTNWLQAKYDDAYKDMKDNPFDTDYAKSIMGKYGVMGDKSFSSALAQGAANNDGNFDSYGAAIADKNKLAYYNSGVDAVMNQNNAMDNNILSLYGTAANTYPTMLDPYKLQLDSENNSAVRLNNAIDVEAKNKIAASESKASISGEVPSDAQNNYFFNSNGELADSTLDYGTIIEEAYKAGDFDTVQKASAAREWKTSHIPEYANFTAPTEHQNSTKLTAAERATRAQEAYQKDALDKGVAVQFEGLNSNERIANTNANADITKANTNANAAITTATIGAEADKEIARMKSDGSASTNQNSQIGAEYVADLINSQRNPNGTFGNDAYIYDSDTGNFTIGVAASGKKQLLEQTAQTAFYNYGETVGENILYKLGFSPSEVSAVKKKLLE